MLGEAPVSGRFETRMLNPKLQILNSNQTYLKFYQFSPPTLGRGDFTGYSKKLETNSQILSIRSYALLLSLIIMTRRWMAMRPAPTGRQA
jgi:hypothetical protein